MTEPEDNLILIPPGALSAEEAIDELRMLLPDDVTTMTHLELHFPDEVKFSSYPPGMEFYDVQSKRPWPFHPGESLGDLSWVKHWYFSAFRIGESLMGRYINRSFSFAWLPLEQPLRTPSARYGKYCLESFIETIVFGDPPD